MRRLFQSERANMVHMSEVNEVDHQAMQYMLSEGCIDWQSLRTHTLDALKWHRNESDKEELIASHFPNNAFCNKEYM